jgi:hypothetical protein
MCGVEVPVDVSDEMRPGVVSLPHGWGHDKPGTGMSVAREHAGVNNNVLAPRTRSACVPKVDFGSTHDRERIRGSSGCTERPEVEGVDRLGGRVEDLEQWFGVAGLEPGGDGAVGRPG